MQYYDENGNKIGPKPPTILQIISFNLLIVSVLMTVFTICFHAFEFISRDEMKTLLIAPIIISAIGLLLQIKSEKQRKK